ncbi:MAG: hypothetical protein K6T65_05425 [Peptococcaceae bacterium]|nr:hypothetical protein [Peptococcaceae bacterium]
MGWVGDNNQKFNTLIDWDPDELLSFSFGFFYFEFGKMTLFDRTSLLFKIQNFHENKQHDPYELVDYLLLRNIQYRLRFIPKIKGGFRNNMLALAIVLELNLRKLMRNLR